MSLAKDETKTWFAKVETCLSSQYVPRKNEKFAINANTVIRRLSQMRMKENVGHKVENAITERKRRLQSQKRVYRAKTLLTSEDVSVHRKHDNRAKTEPSQKR